MKKNIFVITFLFCHSYTALAEMVDVCNRGEIGREIVSITKAKNCLNVPQEALDNIYEIRLEDKGLNEIPKNAFQGMSHLSTIRLNNNIKEIPEGVFRGLNSLVQLDLSSNRVLI